MRLGREQIREDLATIEAVREAVGDEISTTIATTPEGVAAQLTYLDEDFGSAMFQGDTDRICFLNAVDARKRMS